MEIIANEIAVLRQEVAEANAGLPPNDLRELVLVVKIVDNVND